MMTDAVEQLNSERNLENYCTNLELAQAFRELADDLLRVGDMSFLESVVPAVTLHQWTYATKDAVCMSGLTKGHPFLNDGPILTSEVFYVNFELGLARTYSRWYRLVGPARVGDYPIS